MARLRRQIISYRVYEVCMRTRKGLPFVCTKYMKLILEGILARVQRDYKVILCHYVWMGNHPHIIIVAKDSVQCTRFYGEVKKQLTDAIKRLLGREHLCLWQKNGTSVVHCGDAAGVIERIAYLYANPARANLVESIERYPGLSSFEEFRSVTHTFSFKASKSCPWIRQTDIKKLPSWSVTPRQDAAIVLKMKKSSKQEHTLTLTPNAWMKAFKISESEIEEINNSIIQRLKELESEAKAERTANGLKVKGASRLSSEALSLSYRPEKESRKIFVYVRCKELRISLIKAYEDFCERCRECYKAWKIGDYRVVWPPGAFNPAMPPRYNAFYS